MATVLGVFNSEDKAKSAINKMKNQGISEDKISILARRTDSDDVEAGEEIGGTDQNLTDGTVTGGALGGIAGLLAGAGLMTIPGAGPILAAGPLASAFSGAAAGGIGGGLADYGLDKEAGEKYADKVEQGNILVAAEDTEESKLNDVADILREEGADDVETH